MNNNKLNHTNEEKMDSSWYFTPENPNAENEELLRLKDEEIQYYKTELEKSKAENRKLDDKNADLEVEKVEVEKDNVKLQMDNSYLQSDNVTLKKANEALEEDVKKLEQDKNDLKKENENTIKNLLAKFDENQKILLAQHKTQVESMDRALKNQVKVRKNLEIEKQKLELEKKALELEKHELELDKLKLRNMVNELNTKYDNLQKQFDDFRQQTENRNVMSQEYGQSLESYYSSNRVGLSLGDVVPRDKKWCGIYTGGGAAACGVAGGLMAKYFTEAWITTIATKLFTGNMAIAAVKISAGTAKSMAIMSTLGFWGTVGAFAIGGGAIILIGYSVSTILSQREYNKVTNALLQDLKSYDETNQKEVFEAKQNAKLITYPKIPNIQYAMRFIYMQFIPAINDVMTCWKQGLSSIPTNIHETGATRSQKSKIAEAKCNERTMVLCGAGVDSFINKVLRYFIKEGTFCVIGYNSPICNSRFTPISKEDVKEINDNMLKDLAGVKLAYQKELVIDIMFTVLDYAQRSYKAGAVELNTEVIKIAGTFCYTGANDWRDTIKENEIQSRTLNTKARKAYKNYETSKGQEGIIGR